MNRDRLLDFLLGELPPDEARAFAERLAREPELAREAALYRESLGVLREAAREPQWNEIPAPRPRGRLVALRVVAAVAALLLVALGLLWMDGEDAARTRVFEPAQAFGALLPEECAADGGIRPAPQDDGYRVLAGRVRAGAVGATAKHPLKKGDVLLEETELSCGAETGACIALPKGGLLFLRPLSTLLLRAREDGRVALRLESGSAATVAGSEPLHLALDGTDLLLTQFDGAALLRQQESDVLCLRGRLELHLESGVRWRVPAGHRLPAACAHEPESAPFRVERLELDWYEALVGQRARRETVRLDAEGRAGPLHAAPGALLYVAAASRTPLELVVRCGDGPGRTFRAPAGRTLEIRVPLETLGQGGALRITPPLAVQQVRLFEPE